MFSIAYLKRERYLIKIHLLRSEIKHAQETFAEG